MTGDHLALTIGLDYSRASAVHLWGGRAGCGVVTQSRVVSLRLDLGCQWQEIDHDVELLEFVNTFDARGLLAEFYRHQRMQTQTNIYASLTLNTLTPGMFFYPTGGIRVLVGIRFAHSAAFSGVSSLIRPMLQCDWVP